MKVVGIIPCRYKSSRFPGKPLADIGGKPMMWHVYHQAMKSQMLQAVYIATEDSRIASACQSLGLNVLMTRDDHATGTDRVAECAGLVAADIYVNVQGDEPMIDPAAITAVAQAMIDCSDSAVMASNAYAPIEIPTDAVDTNVVKVLLARDNIAMAYSRMPIPFPKGRAVTFLRQLGIYAFRHSGLELFSRHVPGPVEEAEGVEMLRFLETGHKVLMVKVTDRSVAVDTESDLKRVRMLMAAKS